MHQAIYDRLKLEAQAHRTPTYTDIALLAGLRMENPADRNQLAKLLGEISRYEHQQGRPLLSAIVVHVGANNSPGGGFYSLARHLGVFAGKTDLEKLTFWTREVQKVFDAWSQSPPPGQEDLDAAAFGVTDANGLLQ